MSRAHTAPRQRSARVRPAAVLQRGTGPMLTGPHRMTADYLGVVRGSTRPVDTTCGKEPASPSTAYGSSPQHGIPAGSTLVFVVDVLGVG